MQTSLQSALQTLAAEGRGETHTGSEHTANQGSSRRSFPLRSPSLPGCERSHRDSSHTLRQCLFSLITFRIIFAFCWSPLSSLRKLFQVLPSPQRAEPGQAALMRKHPKQLMQMEKASPVMSPGGRRDEHHPRRKANS